MFGNVDATDEMLN